MGHLGAVEDFFIQFYRGFSQFRRLVSMYDFYSFSMPLNITNSGIAGEFYKDTLCSAEKILDICFLTDTLEGQNLEESCQKGLRSLIPRK